MGNLPHCPHIGGLNQFSLIIYGKSINHKDRKVTIAPNSYWYGTHQGHKER
jgi:hypothetical protein